MKNIEQMERIIQYMEAGFPILYINTYEEKIHWKCCVRRQFVQDGRNNRMESDNRIFRIPFEGKKIYDSA